MKIEEKHVKFEAILSLNEICKRDIKKLAIGQPMLEHKYMLIKSLFMPILYVDKCISLTNFHHENHPIQYITIR